MVQTHWWLFFFFFFKAGWKPESGELSPGPTPGQPRGDGPAASSPILGCLSPPARRGCSRLKKMGASLPYMLCAGPHLCPSTYRLCAGPHLCPSRDGRIDCPLAGMCWALQFPAGLCHPAGLVGGLCSHGVCIRRRRHVAVPTIAHVFLAVVPCGAAAFILHFLLEFEGGIFPGEDGLVASEASTAHVCTLVWRWTEKEDCLPFS